MLGYVWVGGNSISMAWHGVALLWGALEMSNGHIMIYS